MPGHCKLSPELNQCADFLPPDQCRCEETKCGFYVPDRPQVKEEKKKKWYEQYYK